MMTSDRHLEFVVKIGGYHSKLSSEELNYLSVVKKQQLLQDSTVRCLRFHED